MVEDPRSPGECRQRALRLLALRTHFSSELAAKLAKRGFDSLTVEFTLDRLVDDGIVDDHAAGLEFVETRLRRKPLGPARLRADLARRGLDRDLVERVVDEAYPKDEEALARRSLASAPGRDAAASARRLERQGFSAAVIGRLVEELRAESSA